jgi:hypothetical protein
MKSIDQRLRQLERKEDSLQYKLLRRRLGFGEVLPTEFSPEIFKTTELLIEISNSSYNFCDWDTYAFGIKFKEGEVELVENGKGFGLGEASGMGAFKAIGDGYGFGEGEDAFGDGGGWGCGKAFGDGGPGGAGIGYGMACGINLERDR